MADDRLLLGASMPMRLITPQANSRLLIYSAAAGITDIGCPHPCPRGPLTASSPPPCYDRRGVQLWFWRWIDRLMRRLQARIRTAGISRSK
jgi:hypothetical protein